MLDRWRSRLAARRQARAIRILREQLAALGYPVDHLTDDELERGIEAAAQAGLTTAEALAGVRRLARM